MDDAARAYIDAIDPDHRPLFDRIQRLIVADHPDVDVVISYQIPTFVVGGRRLYVGAWKHGVSLYGWGADEASGSVARHPELTSGKGTIRLRPADAAAIDDVELGALLRGALRG